MTLQVTAGEIALTARGRQLLVPSLAFRLLGPLDVTRNGVTVPIRAAKLRTLLALLLVDANRVVPAGDLADRLWDGDPPPSARATLQSYVMRLRRALADTAGGAADDPIVTHPDGYEIRVDPDALDLHRFTTLVRAAGGADPARASTVLTEALSLWRGEPLSDVPATWLAHQVVPALVEQRLAAIEQRVDADLRLGRHHDVITELRELTDRYPLREAFWAQRMLALYRADRQAESLDCYQLVRAGLADELGVDPGPRLRELHQAILTNDPALAPPMSRPAGQVPRQLPTGTGRLRGRSGELTELTDWLAEAEADTAADPGLPLLAVIVGPGGIGKTALALRWAHRIAHRFPDGQLHVDLRGYGPDPAVDPAIALAGLLHSLHVPADRVPAGVAERAAMFRSLCHGRRMMIVLDNARDEAQVRPLLPGPGPLVVVTSRSQLRGLVAREAGHRVALGPISVPATAELLADITGTPPDAYDPIAVDGLVTACAGLPLAVRVVAERMARDGYPLADAVAELRARPPLDALGGDDDLTDVRTVLSWSYHALDSTTARAFRLLGAQPGHDIGTAAATVLLGEPPAKVLDKLVGAHLLTRPAPGRYGFHDLLRAFAAERFTADGDDPAPVRALLDWYVRRAADARQTVHPTSAYGEIGLPARPAGPAFADVADAMGWFEAEHVTLSAWIRYAYDTGADDRCWQLAWAVGMYWARSGMQDSWLAASTDGLAAARRSGSYQGQSHMLNGLGGAHLNADEFARAESCFQSVLALASAEGDTFLRAAALGNLAVAQSRQGRYADALATSRRSLEFYEQLPAATVSVINAHLNIGHQLIQMGRYAEAIEHQQRGLALGTASDVDRPTDDLIANIGLALAGLGRHGDAVVQFDRALATARRNGFRLRMSEILIGRGDCLAAMGKVVQARESWAEALELAVELGLPSESDVRAKLAALPAPERAVVRP